MLSLISTGRSAGSQRPRTTRFVRELFAVLAPFALGVSPAFAQTRPVNPQAAREASDAATVPLSDVGPDANGRARPLAEGRNDARILSRNEAYNRERAADGRLGIRLGNDMSFRIPN